MIGLLFLRLPATIRRFSCQVETAFASLQTGREKMKAPAVAQAPVITSVEKVQNLRPHQPADDFGLPENFGFAEPVTDESFKQINELIGRLDETIKNIKRMSHAVAQEPGAPGQLR